VQGAGAGSCEHSIASQDFVCKKEPFGHVNDSKLLRKENKKLLGAYN
jgi:hypothetical protein